jgi:hypothetical protein
MKVEKTINEKAVNHGGHGDHGVKAKKSEKTPTRQRDEWLACMFFGFLRVLRALRG